MAAAVGFPQHISEPLNLGELLSALKRLVAKSGGVN